MVENETENLDDIFLEQNQMKNWKCEIMLMLPVNWSCRHQLPSSSMDLIDALNLKISSLFLAESRDEGGKPPLLGHWPTHAENETKTLSGATGLP
jgi:hypothetical protein